MITKNASLSLCFDGCCFLLLLSYNRRFFKSLFFAARAVSRDVVDLWHTRAQSRQLTARKNNTT